MRRFIAVLLAGGSAITCPSATFAQSTNATASQVNETDASNPTQDTTGVPVADGAITSDIVVTARRRSESVQNIPQTVNAVSGESVEKLNILRFEDVSAVVPGLNLSSGEGGVNPSASLRGVTFRVDSAAAPTVALYLNEAPVDASILFQSLFDIGQVEVLRGPQGTLRGVSAPSGSITVSTRRPDTREAGGYASMTGSSLGAINAQAAVNVPVIADILAVRVAGVVDQNQADGVTSINKRLEPFNNTTAGRVSVLFTPTDRLSAFVTYQHLDQKLRTFRQVAGTGGLGGGSAGTAANYNGAPIAASDRLGVGDEPSTGQQSYDLVTGQLDWRIGGQRLSYVGKYISSQSFRSTAVDFVNQIVGADDATTLDSRSKTQSHEVRLSSVDPLAGFLDYTIGGFYSRGTGKATLGFPASYLDGTFGSPSSPRPTIFDRRYSLLLTIDNPQTTSEASAFANVTAHITPATELSLGGRYIVSSKRRSSTLGTIGSGLIAVNVPVPASFCTAIGAAGNTYPGSCDFAIPPIGTVISASSDSKDSPFVYTASLSHRFSGDFLVYANTGSSFRMGPTNAIGINNAGNDPVLNTLTFLPNETSRSYELGFKSTMFDKRLRFNVAGFHQDFKNYIFRTLPTPYLSNTGTTTSVLTATFTAPVNAKVDGVDVDMAFQFSRRFSIGGAFSYANGRIADDLAPCRDSNFDGVPDSGTATVAQFQAAGKSIGLCKSRASISQSPLWNLSAQSEYTAPVADGADGFVRGLLNYYPSNRRASEDFVVGSYVLINAFAGIRSPDGAWEVAAFAKNLLDTKQQLSRDFGSFNYNNLADLFGTSGYNAVTYTPRREFGLNVRYMFGSR